MQGRAPVPLSKEPLFRSDVWVGGGTRALSCQFTGARTRGSARLFGLSLVRE